MTNKLLIVGAAAAAFVTTSVALAQSSASPGVTRSGNSTTGYGTDSVSRNTGPAPAMNTTRAATTTAATPAVTGADESYRAAGERG